MATNIGNDKAIEYIGKKKEVLDILITNLESADVDCTLFRAGVDTIDKDLNAELATLGKAESLGSVQAMNVAAIEGAYLRATKRLEELKISLQTFDIYFQAKNAAENLEKNLENKEVLTPEAVNKMGEIIIIWLDKINASGTREYAGEQRITEYLYDIAYSIMKLEVTKCKKSNVLAWSKTSLVGHNMLNVRAHMEITNAVQNNDGLDRMINELHSKGINPNYLDVNIIKALVDLNRVNETDKIEEKLKEMYQEMDSLKAQLEANSRNVKIIKDDLKEEDKKRKVILRGVLTTFITLGVMIGWAKYSFKIGHDMAMQEKFETVKEHYLEGYGYVEQPVISEELKMEGSAVLYEFSPWEESNGKYERQVNAYDVSAYDINDIEEYTHLDTRGMNPMSSETETKTFLFPNEVYDEAIHYVEKVSQSDEAIITEGSELRQQLFTTLAVLVGYAVLLGSNAILSKVKGPNIFNAFNDIFNSGYDKAKRKQIADNLKEKLLMQKQIIGKNEKMAQDYKRLFEEYKPYIDDLTVQEQYESLGGMKK